MRCTGPSEHTTAVIRVSRSTVSRIPWVIHGRQRPAAGEGPGDALGQGAPTLRLEAGGGVVGHLDAGVGARLEPDVDGGGVAVGGGGVQGRIELVGRDHPRPLLAQGAGDVAGQRAEPAELADHDVQLLERRGDGAQPLQLADGRDSRTGPGAGAVDLQGAHRGGPAHAVDIDAAVALEVLERGGGRRSEDAVDPAAVEPEATERPLQPADVIATQVRCDEPQRAVTGLPRRLDEGEPRRLVAPPVVVQPAMALERLHGGLRRGAEQTRLGTFGREPGGTEAALQIADGVAVLTRGQLEETRNSSSSWSSWDLPLAPTRRFCTSPPLKTRSVGMLITL